MWCRCNYHVIRDSVLVVTVRITPTPKAAPKPRGDILIRVRSLPSLAMPQLGVVLWLRHKSKPSQHTPAEPQLPPQHPP